MPEKRYIVFLIAVLVAFSSFAQVVNKRQAQLIALVGDQCYEAGEYEQAIYYYKAAFSEHPQYVKAQFQIAQSFRMLNLYDSAEHHYDLIIFNDQDFRYPLARFHLAMLMLEKGEKEAAFKNLKAFRSLLVENDQHELKKFNEYYIQAKDEMDKIGLK